MHLYDKEAGIHIVRLFFSCMVLLRFGQRKCGECGIAGKRGKYVAGIRRNDFVSEDRFL